MKKILAAGLMSLVMSGPAWAHGIWVAERHGELAVVYGHGAADDAYDPRKLTKIEGFDVVGGSLPVTVNAQNDHVLLDVDRNTAGLVAEFDNGFWSKDKSGKWHNKAKDEVADAVEGGRYVKYSVTLLKESAHAIKPKGLPLEIVPLADPMRLGMGDKLTVQVLNEGTPVAGATVVADYVNDGDNDSLTTDSDGKVEVTLRNDGLNVITTSLDKDYDDKARADKIGMFTALSFSLPHRH